jgi:hypothetical protein
VAKSEIMAALRAIQTAIHEWELDIDQAYKSSCFGREEIRSLRQQERKLLAMMVEA